MAKRLAITVSGAVSLGSFEAGVLFEIISAIGQHNANPETPPADRIYIDVLTGASAGGMTAAIAAQKLLYDQDALKNAYDNAFYCPWVADVNLDGLLALKEGEDAAKSIFSSDFVADISRRYLTARYKPHLLPSAPNPHPAINRDSSLPAEFWKLHLGLALSNLNGVDYGLPIQVGVGGGTFCADDFIDLPGLVKKLTQSSDALSFYIRNHLHEGTLAALANCRAGATDNGPLLKGLTDDFNLVASRTDLYDSHRFAGVSLRPETRNLLVKRPAGTEQLRLNRLLLEDAWPSELARNQFVYTGHQDKLTRCFNTDDLPADDQANVWEALRNAVLSCGAFPFAFRPVPVKRLGVDYILPNIVSNLPAEVEFTCTDGGVFQNEPLGMAKLLVDEIDRHEDVVNRFFLFVSPGSKDSTATSRHGFNAGNADLKHTTMQLVGAIFAQARFQDWITADGINREIEIFNRRAMELHALLGKEPGLAANLQAATNALLPLLLPDECAKSQARQRLQKQFKPEYDALETSATGVKDIWIDSILTLETAAGLGASDEMKIYGVTARDSELASSPLCAFTGFFDRRFRDHDYDVGRLKARALLQNRLFGLPSPIVYQTESVRPLDPKLAGMQLKDMEAGLRRQVRDGLRMRALASMKAEGWCWLLCKAVDRFVVKRQLDKLLNL